MSQTATSPHRGRSFNSWLLWKETRQLAPLVASLFVVTALLIVAQLLFSKPLGMKRIVIEMTFLIFPGLFATGAGAVMVGQEREQRTMEWLAALPITPRRLVLTKFTIALVVLAALWILAITCMETISSAYANPNSWRTTSIRSPSDGIRYPMLIAHSIVILLSGFYASWRIRDQFQSLCLVAALACLPFVLSESISAVINPTQRAVETHSMWLMASLGLIPIMAFVGYRAAIRSLLPQNAPTARVVQADRVATASRRVPAVPTFGSALTSILWQAIHATPILLGGLALALLTGVSIPTLLAATAAGSDLFQDSPLFLILLIAPVAVSWLGVLVFKNDASSQRIRFLSDRGVSPMTIYLGRHAVPLAVIVTALILYAGVATLVVQNSLANTVQLLPSLTLLLLFFAVVYSVSQWVSQSVRTLTLAVILAPVLSAVAVGWLVTAVSEFRTPIWIVAICTTLPMIATSVLMKRYVDARGRWQFWATSIGVVIAFIVLPILPIFIGLAEYDRMSATQRTTLLKQGRSVLADSPRLIEMSARHWQTDDGTLYSPSGELRSRRSEQWSAQWIGKETNMPQSFLPSLERLRKDPSAATHYDYSAVNSLLNRLMLQRLIFEESAEQDRDAAFEPYASWLSATATVAGALRNSHRLLDNEVADLLEISTVDAMMDPALEPYQVRDEFREIVRLLPDKQQRDANRRDAILAEWTQLASKPTFREKSNAQQIVRLAATQQSALTMQIGGLDRHQESFVIVALDALDRRKGNQRSWERRMHDLVAPQSLPFELGPYSPRLRDLPAMKVWRTDWSYPCRYWGMAWESEIEQLKESSGPTNAEVAEQAA